MSSNAAVELLASTSRATRAGVRLIACGANRPCLCPLELRRRAGHACPRVAVPARSFSSSSTCRERPVFVRGGVLGSRIQLPRRDSSPPPQPPPISPSLPPSPPRPSSSPSPRVPAAAHAAVALHAPDRAQAASSRGPREASRGPRDGYGQRTARTDSPGYSTSEQRRLSRTERWDRALSARDPTAPRPPSGESSVPRPPIPLHHASPPLSAAPTAQGRGPIRPWRSGRNLDQDSQTRDPTARGPLRGGQTQAASPTAAHGSRPLRPGFGIRHNEDSEAATSVSQTAQQSQPSSPPRSASPARSWDEDPSSSSAFAHSATRAPRDQQTVPAWPVVKPWPDDGPTEHDLDALRDPPARPEPPAPRFGLRSAPPSSPASPRPAFASRAPPGAPSPSSSSAPPSSFSPPPHAATGKHEHRQPSRPSPLEHRQPSRPSPLEHRQPSRPSLLEHRQLSRPSPLEHRQPSRPFPLALRHPPPINTDLAPVPPLNELPPLERPRKIAFARVDLETAVPACFGARKAFVYKAPTFTLRVLPTTAVPAGKPLPFPPQYIKEPKVGVNGVEKVIRLAIVTSKAQVSKLAVERTRCEAKFKMAVNLIVSRGVGVETQEQAMELVNDQFAYFGILQAAVYDQPLNELVHDVVIALRHTAAALSRR